MKYRIRHSIPGRLRLTVIPAAGLGEVEACVSRLPGVLGVRINPACASAVILYHVDMTDTDAILDALADLGGLPAGPRLKGMARKLTGPLPRSLADSAASTVSRARTSGSAICSRCSGKADGATRKLRELSPAKKEGIRFAALSGVMGYVFVREVLLKRVVAQGLFSPLGIISLVASLPLVTDSVRHMRARRFSMETFLAGGCVAATATGQAVSALEILWIHSGAECLNGWISERSRRSVSDILALTAKNTFILANGVEMEIPVSGVKPRDIVVLHTGEKVCVDGEIVKGQALVDESPISGRADFVLMETGAQVLAGSYVREGVIHVRADEVGDHTYLARIMREVENNIENRAPIEGAADTLARRMLRLGMAATAGTLLFTGSLWRAFTVMLVMACPCATVLSAKTAVSASMSAAAKRGILIKGGRYLEEVGKADIVCFDKTGTLTSNEPRIETILNFTGRGKRALSEDQLLFLAYSAEIHNHHPLARAIVKEARRRGIDPIPHMVCDFTLGKGGSRPCSARTRSASVTAATSWKRASSPAPRSTRPQNCATGGNRSFSWPKTRRYWARLVSPTSPGRTPRAPLRRCGERAWKRW